MKRIKYLIKNQIWFIKQSPQFVPLKKWKYMSYYPVAFFKFMRATWKDSKLLKPQP